jgi:hypothetical protein
VSHFNNFANSSSSRMVEESLAAATTRRLTKTFPSCENRILEFGMFGMPCDGERGSTG